MGSDSRDATNWVVLELTRTGEQRAEEGTLADALREALGCSRDHQVFIPMLSYVRDGTRVNLHLMEGYAFVASGLPEVCYLNLEKDSPYIRKVLTAPGPNGMPVLSVLPDTVIQEMREKLRAEMTTDITEGMRVRILQGAYSNLEGEVLGFEEEDAHVHIELRSFNVIRAVPRMFLDPVEA